MNYAVTIDSVEKIIGYNFLPSMHDKAMRDMMEKNNYTRLWK